MSSKHIWPDKSYTVNYKNSELTIVDMTEIGTKILKKDGNYQPCKRCGHCCEEENCLISESLIKSETRPCPALKYIEGIAHCDMMENPLEYTKEFGNYTPGTREHRDCTEVISKMVKTVLSVGKGCGANYTVNVSISEMLKV